MKLSVILDRDFNFTVDDVPGVFTLTNPSTEAQVIILYATANPSGDLGTSRLIFSLPGHMSSPQSPALNSGMVSFAIPVLLTPGSSATAGFYWDDQSAEVACHLTYAVQSSRGIIITSTPNSEYVYATASLIT